MRRPAESDDAKPIVSFGSIKVGTAWFELAYILCADALATKAAAAAAQCMPLALYCAGPMLFCTRSTRRRGGDTYSIFSFSRSPTFSLARLRPLLRAAYLEKSIPKPLRVTKICCHCSQAPSLIRENEISSIFTRALWVIKYLCFAIMSPLRACSWFLKCNKYCSLRRGGVRLSAREKLFFECYLRICMSKQSRVCDRIGAQWLIAGRKSYQSFMDCKMLSSQRLRSRGVYN